MLEKENTPKEYNGKQYTTYEALQQQRKMETAMRATRQQIKLLQEGGADAQEIMLKKAKYQGQMQAYKDFSKQMGLPEQVKRIYQDGLGGKFSLTKKEAKVFKRQQNYDKIKAELKEAGIKGEPVLNPERIDLSEFGFDEKHINVERAHHVTRADAQKYVNEAEIALKRWKGQYMNYYSKSGAAYVDVKNKNVRTAFSIDEFDENVKKILEVIEKYG